MTPDTDETFCDVLRRWAILQPNAPAFVGDRVDPMCYAALVDQVDAFQKILNSTGFGRGDRIGVVHRGGAEMAAAIVCIWNCATAVPLNDCLTEEEFRIDLSRMRVDAMLTDASNNAAARAATSLGIPILELMSRNDGVAGSILLKTASIKSVSRPGRAGTDDCATILTTSGTTSKSKLVPWEHRRLLQRYAKLSHALELTTRDRCLNLMPLFRGHGINAGIGLNLFSGSSVLFLRPFDVPTFERYVRTLCPTWYTGAYTIHHQIHKHSDFLKEAVVQSPLRFARSGSGPLVADVAAGIERTFSIPVIQTYISTETGVVAANPQPPRARKFGSVGLPVDSGTRILDEAGRALPRGRQGEVSIPADSVFDGYEDDDDANAAAFRDGYYRTGDSGYLDKDGYLFLTGRIKEVINRGGEKVAPFEVEQALCSLPQIANAAVYPIPHPTLGEEVAAVIETVDDAFPESAVIDASLREKLAAFKIPRRYDVVGEIPVGPGGRIVRRDLARQLGNVRTRPHAAGRSGAEPRTDIERQLHAVWTRILAVEEIGTNENFFAVGGDSLQAIELFLQMEKTLGIVLPQSALLEDGTIAGMARQIVDDTATPCLVRLAPDGARPPFFCIHGADGNTVYFRNLAERLGPSQPFYALQSVGLDGKELPLTRIDAMADRYWAEIRTVQSCGPYYLGGYSFGGRVAYAIAQKIRAEGEEVALLAMIDTYRPSGGALVGLWDGTRAHLRRMKEMPWSKLPIYIATRVRNLGRVLARKLPEPAFAQLRDRFGDSAQSVPRSLRLDPIEAHEMAKRAFDPSPFDGDIVMFMAAGTVIEKHGGWADLVAGRVTVHKVDGSHADMLSEPQVGALAERLGSVLRARQETFGKGGSVGT